MANNSILVWRPDTCGCVIHLAYDDRLSPDQRTFTPVTWEDAEEIVRARRDAGEPNINPNAQPSAHLCPAHAHLVAPSVYQTILDENLRKNQAIGAALEAVPDLKVRDIKWSFDDERKLKLDVTGISDAQRGEIKSALDSKLGSGKVSLT